MRILSTILFLFLLTSLLPAQSTLVPLTGNPELMRKEAERALPHQAREKNVCLNLERPGVIYVIAGESGRVDIDPDDYGLGSDGELNCVNCDQLTYGTAVLEGEDLIYTANTDVEAGKDIVEVEYCVEGECASRFFHFIARRASLYFYPDPVEVEAESETVITADPGELPGPLRCASVFDCPDDYEGRTQQQYLTDYNTPVSSFTYIASRHPGDDEVCLVLCDTFTICDTLFYTMRVTNETLSLPFMDDFSYRGPYPTASLWLDETPFVNNDLAVEPPSVGVATFDGLDRSGTPYGGNFGEADRLTSKYIDLSGVSGELVLTYWLQPSGLGNKPEPRDSMVLEFKNNQGAWVSMRRFEGVPNNQPSTVIEPFRFYAQPVGQNFRHGQFQFRFKNHSERTGLLDVWHLDYVRLDRNETDTTISDIAFTADPLPILEPYSSMPWRHFKGNETGQLSETISARLYNHAEQTLNADPSAVRVRETNTNIELYNVTLFNGQEANIPNQQNLFRQYSLIDDNTGFPPVWSDYLQILQGPAFDDLERPEFVTTYRLSNASQISDPGFEAVQRNDTVRQVTIFDNYFAYDDGTAEAGLVAGQGNEVAVRFTATVEDSLRAIRLHIPHTSIDVSDQRFNLKVWVGELDDEPEYSQIFVRPVYFDDFFDELHGFSTYPLVNENGELTPLYLPPGDFYLGWEQETPCQGTQCIPVGYDRNSPGAKEFVMENFGQGWVPLLEQLPGGALMIHPVVGSTTPGFTDTDEAAPLDQQLRVFPNPARDYLRIHLADGLYQNYRFRLLTSTGQPARQGPLAPELSLGQLPAGLYWLEVTNQRGQERVIQKIAIAR